MELTFLDRHVAAEVIEFKNKEYALKQCFNEMICTAGNLLATSLLLGNQVSLISIFGLAINYNNFIIS